MGLFALSQVAARWAEERERAALEYVLAENRALRAALRGALGPRRLCFDDRTRRALAVRAHAVGRAALATLATIAAPDTLLRWHRNLVRGRARPAPTTRGEHGGARSRHEALARLVTRMARDNPGWGYSRLQGALFELGHEVGRGTIARMLARAGLGPAPERSRAAPWRRLSSSQLASLAALDFFQAEVLTARGARRCLVLVAMRLATRKVAVLGVLGAAKAPTAAWTHEAVRRVTCRGGIFEGVRRLVHDRDPLFRHGLAEALAPRGITTVMLPPRSPNLNAHMERFIRSVRDECLRHVLPLGERHLERVLAEYVVHYHEERPHQGLGNRIPARAEETPRERRVANDNGLGPVKRRKRLGGLLSYYHREAG